MMTLRDLWVVYKARKATKALRNTFRLYADVLDPEARNALETRFIDIDQAIRCAEIEDLPQVVKTLESELNAALPKQRYAWAAEWFDILVSALAVAFCFRAYYYQPFKIPTGSMMPTLYGIHVEDGGTPSAWDAQPLRFIKWCVTGSTYEEVRVKQSGVLVRIYGDLVPGYTSLFLRNRLSNLDRYDLPDAAAQKLRAELVPGKMFNAGHILWRGTVKSGDFLFVNRWIWNFRHPRLGETIVFSTRSLKGLPDNQHYIKRLCGRPGDTIEIKDNDTHLYLNGAPLKYPKLFDEIAQHDYPWKGSPAYPGYRPATPGGPYTTTISTFNLGPGRYVALGDNSPNSLDSRYWGTVPARNLLGPATFVHWPFTSPRWGFIR